MKDVIIPIAQYAARTKDDALRKVSTSGGVFTELARVALSSGGVVVGVGWQKSPFRPAFKVAHSESDLAEMRGAKYIWSGKVAGLNVGNNSGLFVGLPCQIAVARKLYGDKFVYCALICHSTPELEAWDYYVRSLEKHYNSKIKNVIFRSKENGIWRRNNFVAEFENGEKYVVPSDDNIYTNAYFMGFSTRNVCANCTFKGGHHGADLVIGDFWGIEKWHPELDDGKGLSAVLAYTERGENFLRSANLALSRVEYQRILSGNPHLERNIKIDVRRKRLFMSLYRFLGIKIASRIARSRIGNWL